MRRKMDKREKFEVEVKILCRKMRKKKKSLRTGIGLSRMRKIKSQVEVYRKF